MDIRKKNITITLGLIVLLISHLTSKAQQPMSMVQIDALTYKQYTAEQWSDLIKTGKEALANDIDFYYLQVRMGIANYNLKKYKMAIPYLEKAMLANKDNKVVQEFLYLTYLYAEQYHAARFFSDNFSSEQKKSIGIPLDYPWVQSLYLDTKIDFFDTYKITPETTDDLDQKSVDSQNYYNISLSHVLSKNRVLHHGFTHIKSSNTVLSSDRNLPKEFSEKLTQYQYFTQLTTYLNKGWTWGITAHYLHTNYFAVINMNPGLQRTNTLYDINEKTFAFNTFISKDIQNFTCETGISFSNLNNGIQFQPEINITYFHLGNTKLYTSSMVFFQMSSYDAEKNNELIFNQAIGIQVLKYVLIEPSVTLGSMHNFVSYHGLIANNDPDNTLNSYNLLVNVGLKKGIINLFLKYQNNQKENHYTLNDEKLSNRFDNQSFIGGLKWYF